MASITKVYARAFADVVTSRRLDSDKVLAEAKSFAKLMSESKDLREVWDASALTGAETVAPHADRHTHDVRTR